MKTQYHLKGRGFSGRAVRVRTLDPIEVEDNLKHAAKLVGMDATVLELKKTEWRMGSKLMLVEFTEPCEDPLAPEVKWSKVGPSVLDDFGAYFTPKDVQALEAIYRDANELLPSELDAITGKAIPVSAG